MTDQRQPITPVSVETQMLRDTARLEQLQRDLVEARNAENEASKKLQIAKVLAEGDPDCPRVQRGVVTVAERKAWIDAQILDEKLAYQDAKSRRQIATDALRNARRQSEITQSIGSSVRTAYNTTRGTW